MSGMKIKLQVRVDGPAKLANILMRSADKNKDGKISKAEYAPANRDSQKRCSLSSRSPYLQIHRIRPEFGVQGLRCRRRSRKRLRRWLKVWLLSSLQRSRSSFNFFFVLTCELDGIWFYALQKPKPWFRENWSNCNVLQRRQRVFLFRFARRHWKDRSSLQFKEMTSQCSSSLVARNSLRAAPPSTRDCLARK